jgi:L-alanine-DL-glutamate epimerase-like enolase superfamily enzyme
MIGGMVESMLAMSMSAHVAAGLGGFTFVDLDTPMFLAENPFIGGFRQTGDQLALDHIDAGHGVRPRAE